MTDLSIASSAAQAPYAPRERTADAATTGREGVKTGSFAEMQERFEKGRGAKPDQKTDRPTSSARDTTSPGAGGRGEPHDVASAEPRGPQQTVAQGTTPATDARSNPLALLIGLAAPVPSQAGDRRGGQASEQENTDMTDLPLAARVPQVPAAPRDRTADVDGKGVEIGAYAEMAERPEKTSLKPEQTAERLVLSARELMIAVAGGRRDIRDAGTTEPDDTCSTTGQEAAPAIPAKSDPIAQLIGVVAAPVSPVEPQRAAPSPPSSRPASLSDALSSEARVLPDVHPATTKPVDQGPREGRPQGRDASISVNTEGSGIGLKVSEIVDVDSASHFAPAGSALQQVATAVRESLGPAPSTPVKPGPEATVAQETTAPLQVLNLKLQPEALGNVAVHMRLSGDILSMHIKVSDAATLASFQSGSNKLEDLLKASGYQVDKLTIVAAAPTPATDQAPSGDAGARRDGNASTMTPSGEQSQERSGQAQDGQRGAERQGGFKGNGGQSHEASAPRTTRAGVYL
ncbi:flagellar hook-length control protein FliK [Methylocella sp. CPCC 101449]|uniref:flagellar hook-length control protein FliK n=1 Tax=Methylocella sp. CPCC 101449 TaxID=2987531 RepID=UPI00288D9C4D|nr:flagellar hook-length control protein FliK [Methylocella sp. CPCC 101449]MDT2021141.1 flagellar hook-length control protein FliK [Methylocella sp. CPCC 101449]